MYWCIYTKFIVWDIHTKGVAYCIEVLVGRIGFTVCVCGVVDDVALTGVTYRGRNRGIGCIGYMSMNSVHTTQ